MHNPPLVTSNFAHLQEHGAQLVRLGLLAERYFPDDPNTSLLKLRQLAELLAQLVATTVGLYQSAEESQYDLLGRLQDEGILPREISQLFGDVRRAGNAASHAIKGDHHTALAALEITWQRGGGSTGRFGTLPSSLAPSSLRKLRQTKAPSCMPNSLASARRWSKTVRPIRRMSSGWTLPKPNSVRQETGRPSGSRWPVRPKRPKWPCSNGPPRTRRRPPHSPERPSPRSSPRLTLPLNHSRSMRPRHAS